MQLYNRYLTWVALDLSGWKSWSTPSIKKKKHTYRVCQENAAHIVPSPASSVSPSHSISSGFSSISPLPWLKTYQIALVVAKDLYLLGKSEFFAALILTLQMVGSPITLPVVWKIMNRNLRQKLLFPVEQELSYIFIHAVKQ